MYKRKMPWLQRRRRHEKQFLSTLTPKTQACFNCALVPSAAWLHSPSSSCGKHGCACRLMCACGEKYVVLRSMWDWHTYFPFPCKSRWKSFKKWIVPLNFKSFKIASYWEFNSFLNVNSGKYLLFKHEYPSAFSHHWKRIILFSPLNSRDHSR